MAAAAATAMAMGAGHSAAELAEDLFLYNRENFQFDRKQRQIMEYQLANMKLEQAKLWRDDIRDFCTLTPEKMEVYLLVVALELGFCVMALCKARAPPGCPPWLVNCHTISVCGALMYLFLALWFGMHAFVSAQAYKVKILTQMVRLPVPSWKAMEASRTYGSAFESIDKAQMLRVPFAMGSQESQAQRCRKSAAADLPDATEMPGIAYMAGTRDASDPWGLERCGDNLQELAPDVNVGVERQRHIWLVREAAKFYQTYDAYCRISMSAGTSNLSIFFAYYCMTYVLTENAAPTAAWAGVLVFVICALTLLRSDLELTSFQYALQSTLICISPCLSFYVTYMSSKHQGNVGQLKFMCCSVLFLHGASLMNYLMLFRVRETQTGAVLPTAFKRILYIDPFGWAKHSASHWRRAVRKHTEAVREVNARVGLKKTPSLAGRIWSSFRRSTSASSTTDASSQMQSPSEHCVQASLPLRPEDVEDLGSATSTVANTFSPMLVRERNRDNTNATFRSGTFAAGEDEAEDEGGRAHAQSDVSTGSDVSGEKPGSGPWRVFKANTIFLALAWEAAFVETVARSASSKLSFHTSLKIPTYGLRPGEIAKLPGLVQDHGSVSGSTWGQPMQPALVGERLQTTWKHGFGQPRGLACDHHGTHFLTSGRASDGSAGIVHGRLAKLSNAVQFGPTSTCMGHGGKTGMRIQDVALHTCTDEGCTALVLQKEATHLTACHSGSLEQQRNASTDSTGSNKLRTLPLSQMWLDDRGGVPSSRKVHERHLLHPERVSAIGTVPCEKSKAKRPEGCVVVGTTARRGVHMAVAGEREWRPSALLWSNRGEAPDAGTLTAVGNKYLAALQKGPGIIQLLDVQNGGTITASWRLLSPATNHGRWSSICAAGGSFYALEEGQQPAIWRFRMPPEFAIEA